jgi:hypothetical protein
MSILGYYYDLSLLETTAQIATLKSSLEYHTSRRIWQILSENISSDNKYCIISALVARYIWLDTNSNLSLNNMHYNIHIIRTMPHELNHQQRQTLFRLVIDSLAPVTEAEINALRFNGSKIIEYIANLPFPYNIKCLSESLMEKTWLYKFFSVMPIDSPDLPANLYQMEIIERLESCNIQAFREQQFSMIAPELAATLGNPDLMEHIPVIYRLLQEHDELSTQSLAWANNITVTIKNAVLRFVMSIPDHNIQNSYLNKGTIRQIMARRTYAEQITGTLTPRSTSMLSWMENPPAALRPTLSPIGQEPNTTLNHNRPN